MWPSIWSVATTRIGFWTWIWSMRRHWTGAGGGLLISMLEKLNQFCLTCLITLMLLMWKWMGLFLWKNEILRCWDWLSLLDWIGALTLSVAKTASKKIEALFGSMKFFLLRLLCISINAISPCMEYFCLVWDGAHSCYLELIDKLQTQICKTVDPSLATSLKPLAYHWNVASLIIFCRYYFVRCSSQLGQLVLLPFQGRSTRYSDILHDFSVTIPRCYRDVSVNSLFPA